MDVGADGVVGAGGDEVVVVGEPLEHRVLRVGLEHRVVVGADRVLDDERADMSGSVARSPTAPPAAPRVRAAEARRRAGEVEAGSCLRRRASAGTWAASCVSWVNSSSVPSSSVGTDGSGRSQPKSLRVARVLDLDVRGDLAVFHGEQDALAGLHDRHGRIGRREAAARLAQHGCSQHSAPAVPAGPTSSARFMCAVPRPRILASRRCIVRRRARPQPISGLGGRVAHGFLKTRR